MTATRLFRAFVICGTLMAPSGLALADTHGAFDCGRSDAMDPDKVVGKAMRGESDMLFESIAFYDEFCDGGLWMVNIGSPDVKIARVNASWQLYEFKSAAFAQPEKKDAEDGDVIIVTASFVTGIGSTGAQPFTVRIPMTRAGDTWFEGEAEVVEE